MAERIFPACAVKRIVRLHRQKKWQDSCRHTQPEEEGVQHGEACVLSAAGLCKVLVWLLVISREIHRRVALHISPDCGIMESVGR